MRRFVLLAALIAVVPAAWAPVAWATGDNKDSPGVARWTGSSYQWNLTNGLGGNPLHVFNFGSGGTPVAGDWDGDGVDTPGVVIGNHWLLSNGYDGLVDLDFYYGNPGDTPVVGDWNGDGIDTPGVRRTHYWYLSDDFNGNVSHYFGYGNDSGDTPVVGDWNGDGIDTVGVRRTHYFWLSNGFDGSVAYYFGFGNDTGDVPVAGDWDGNGTDTVGVRRTHYWWLTNDHSGNVAYYFGYGNDNGDTPVVGDWDNEAIDTFSDEAVSYDSGGGDRQLQASSPIVAFAPLVYIHPAEDNFPGSARRNFLRWTELRWSRDLASDVLIAGRGQVRATHLGGWVSSPYVHNSCATTDGVCRTYASSNYTRPRGTEAGRAFLAGVEGFFLDLKNNGQKSGVSTLANDPVYYEYSPGHFVQYWFFYPFDDAISGFNHEGDWERIAIKLDASNQPTTVRLYRHNCFLDVPWSNPLKSGTHPIIFSANGTHGSYSRPGAHGTHDCTGSSLTPDDQTDYGPAWSTWKFMADVTRQPWYGFGGAWGEVGNGALTTGPLGPSRYKPPPPW
jgi:hypothetical protein